MSWSLLETEKFSLVKTISKVKLILHQDSRDSFNRSKASISTMDTLKNENEILRAKIKRLEES